MVWVAGAPFTLSTAVLPMKSLGVGCAGPVSREHALSCAYAVRDVVCQPLQDPGAHLQVGAQAALRGGVQPDGRQQRLRRLKRAPLALRKP